MNDFAQKLAYLKWLKIMDVEYYFSAQKASDISLFEVLKAENKQMNAVQDSQELMPLEQIGLSKQIKTNNFVKVNNTEGLDAAITARQLADKANNIYELRETLQGFNGCDLKHFAMNTVFADGDPSAKVMLIGEAPGAKEDEMGIPFCGESGMLLDIMLKTIGLSRKENIYITNTIFWRPPANRKPTPKEIEICRPFLEKHIALINPKLLICVGSTAVAGLLGDKVQINNARAKLHQYTNQYLGVPIATMAIFHPAYLLRQPGKKKDTWFDLLRIKQFITENLYS